MIHYTFIASDYKPRTGGIAAYLDSLARGLMGIGNTVHVLGVVQPEERGRIAFLENYEPWVSPFLLAHDRRPKHWLGNKAVSALQIARCQSSVARRVLDRTPLFRSSAESASALKQMLRNEKPGMIVFGHSDINLYPLALLVRREGLPYGVIAHDAEVYRFGNRKNDLVRRGMLLKGAKWIAANSRHTKALVKMWGIAEERIMIVHPPISEQMLAESSSAHRMPGEDVYSLITVARIVRGKGIDVVLRALKILDERKIPFRYVVAGEGPERKCLERLAAELGVNDWVHFTGYVTDESKWSLLRAADLFVMPSRVHLTDQHEGFGLAFVEAAALGVPAVGSNAGGIPDAVVDGQTGILVEPDSPGQLADALTLLYQHPEMRREMGKAGMKRAKTQFAPRAIAAHFEEEIFKRTGIRHQTEGHPLGALDKASSSA